MKFKSLINTKHWIECSTHRKWSVNNGDLTKYLLVNFTMPWGILFSYLGYQDTWVWSLFGMEWKREHKRYSAVALLILLLLCCRRVLLCLTSALLTPAGSKGTQFSQSSWYSQIMTEEDVSGSRSFLQHIQWEFLHLRVNLPEIALPPLCPGNFRLLSTRFSPKASQITISQGIFSY